MALSYRIKTEDDEAALIRLWSEQSGWDAVDAATWGHRLLRAPFGEAAIALAVEDGTREIVGQFAFIPSLVCVNGREVRAARPFAPIVSRRVRGFQALNPFDHPVFKMYRCAVNELRQRGEQIIYMVPDPRWLRAFRMVPGFQTSSFPLWSLKLPLDRPLELCAGYTARLVEASGEHVDQLWRKALMLHGCAVVRDSRVLPWKTSHGDYKVLGVARNGELVGLTASLRKKHDKQWLICDMLTADADDSLRATLVAVINHAHEQSLVAAADIPISKIAVLATPLMEPILRDLRFFRDEYDFPVVVQVLDPSLSKEEVAPARWYVSAND